MVLESRFSERLVDPQAFLSLRRDGLQAPMAKLLASRGIASMEEMKLGLQGMIPVHQLTNAYAMANHLADAIRDRKKIIIVADYDCDGATACTICYRALQAYGAIVDYFVPSRFLDGYGLTGKLVEKILPQKPDILLTVDNGISSIEGVDVANKHGIPVLVTDHHLPGDRAPNALCIVNPNQHGCTFPSKNLAGCGVAWYVMVALFKVLDERDQRPNFDVRSLLDLVALGTIADVVKLDYNNRCLVSVGLQRIREGKTVPAIAAMMELAGRELAETSSFDMGFILGPRINAVGRMSDASIGINALISDDPAKARQGAEAMEAENVERKERETEVREEAERIAESVNAHADRYTMIIDGEDWHEGVVGIVASRVKDRYNRPTIVLSRGDTGEWKGSGRSIPSLHLRDCLDLVHARRPDIFVKFGGHAMAAGMTIQSGKVDDFKEEFEKAARSMLKPEDLQEIVETDGELRPEDMSFELAEFIRSQIWGNGFPAPQFQGEFKVEGQQVLKEKHLRLQLRKGMDVWKGMMFFHTEPLPDFVRVAYSLDVNEFRGNKELQLMVHKVQKTENTTTSEKSMDWIHETPDGYVI